MRARKQLTGRNATVTSALLNLFIFALAFTRCRAFSPHSHTSTKHSAIYFSGAFQCRSDMERAGSFSTHALNKGSNLWLGTLSFAGESPPPPPRTLTRLSMASSSSGEGGDTATSTASRVAVSGRGDAEGVKRGRNEIRGRSNEGDTPTKQEERGSGVTDSRNELRRRLVQERQQQQQQQGFRVPKPPGWDRGWSMVDEVRTTGDLRRIVGAGGGGGSRNRGSSSSDNDNDLYLPKPPGWDRGWSMVGSVVAAATGVAGGSGAAAGVARQEGEVVGSGSTQGLPQQQQQQTQQQQQQQQQSDDDATVASSAATPIASVGEGPAPPAMTTTTAPSAEPPQPPRRRRRLAPPSIPPRISVVKRTQPTPIEVEIVRPTMNSRKISASLFVDRPLADVWSILTDYDNLATHVPNLVQSRVIEPSPTSGGFSSQQQQNGNGRRNNLMSGGAGGRGNSVRLFQEGAQKIIGFDFSASLTMDMREVLEAHPSSSSSSLPPTRQVQFRLVESQFFSEFDGSWMLEGFRRRIRGSSVSSGDESAGGALSLPSTEEWEYRTKLTYEVFIRPNGPVPVVALEWRIKEDIPVNLRAVKAAAENLPLPRFASSTLKFDAVGNPLPADSATAGGGGGEAGGTALRRQQRLASIQGSASTPLGGGRRSPSGGGGGQGESSAGASSSSSNPGGAVEWESEETLGRYMNEATATSPSQGDSSSSNSDNSTG